VDGNLMSHFPATPETASDAERTTYQPVPESLFATEFWEFYRILWDLEARFDLIFRKDRGVFAWTANRVRFYYDFAAQLGLYEAQEKSAAPNSPEEPINIAQPLEPVDLYIQTGAVGPATANRTRPFGCVYTAHTVAQLLDAGARILLVHDAPDSLQQHPRLHAITNAQLRAHARAASDNARAPRISLDAEAQQFWGEVRDCFKSRLGVDWVDDEKLQALIARHRQQVAWHKAFLSVIRPNAFICMTHYFRGPQLEAAKRLGIHTIDYQHGINSRYHLGYGFPNVQPDKRTIPYFPDEFWSWGRIWADEDWFPAEACKVRAVGHPGQQNAQAPDPLESRPEKTVLIATSWAMRSSFHAAIRSIASVAPDWKLKVKLHPRERVEDYSDLCDAHPQIEIIPGDRDVIAEARSVRYVVSICSSSLFDVLLSGCKIGVLRLPSVEYAEDFVRRFQVPVLDPDGSNFLEAVGKMQTQDIPIEDVFHRMSGGEVALLQESLTIPRERVWVQPARTVEVEEPGEDDGGHRPAVALWNRERPIDVAVSPMLPDGEVVSTTDFRTWLDQSPPPRVAADRLAGAIRAGLDPARVRGDIRKVLQDLDLMPWSGRASRGLLAAIEADEHPSADILRAELFERYITAKRGIWGRLPQGQAGRTWPLALERLAGLAPMLETFAQRYASIANEAANEYGDTRVSPPDQARLRRDLVARLSDPAPFSMVRVGDGEVYAFDASYVPSETNEADRAVREEMWWQRTLDDNLRERLRAEAQDAICEADYLGVPSAYRLLRDLPRLLPRMRGPIAAWPKTARAHRILFEEFERLRASGRLDWMKKSLIDDRCHQELFTISGLRRFRIPGRPRILVNCFPYQQMNAALRTDFFSGGIRLPPHAKVREFVPDDHLATATAPHMLDDLMDQVATHAANGALFFVAGGFVGKILIGHAKRMGGSALDIGAVADYWMGHVTRGPQDFTRFRR
jgi:hypothetical protein